MRGVETNKGRTVYVPTKEHRPQRNAFGQFPANKRRHLNIDSPQYIRVYFSRLFSETYVYTSTYLRTPGRNSCVQLRILRTGCKIHLTLSLSFQAVPVSVQFCLPACLPAMEEARKICTLSAS